MDRAVLNEANLRNANLQRTIFTRCACCGSFVAAIKLHKPFLHVCNCACVLSCCFSAVLQLLS